MGEIVVMIKIAIVEDDEDCAKRTENFIERYCNEAGYDFRITLFKNGINFLNDYRAVYDIVFMDIEMPHMDGLKTAHKLREMDSVVCLIFITNMAQYAIKGYEVDAMDYLVKPIEYFNFTLKLKKAIKIWETRPKECLAISQPGGNVRLEIANISYIEVKDHQVEFHVGKKSYSVRGTLNLYEKKLMPYGFAKCNHCYLVNLKYVLAINTNFVVLTNGEELQISRPKRKEFLDKLASFVSI